MLSILAQTAQSRIASPETDFLSIAPEMIIIGAAFLLVVAAALNRDRRDLSGFNLAVGLASVLVAGGFTIHLWSVVADDGPYQTLSGMVALDGFSVFARTIVLAATFLGLLVSDGYLRREGTTGPEFHALLLLSASGMLMMTAANDLIVVFLALEILSIPLYVLAAFDKRRLESQEAGLKYFVLGAFSSAVLLYGVALVYGATGTTSLPGIAKFLSANTLTSSGLLLAGIAMLIVGLGFKVAAVPFHMWTPDVYQGSPSPVTGFMAAGAKVAGFAALLRVFYTAFASYQLDWRPLIWVLAVLSLVLGSVVAIVQQDVKRMLAYSSINHAGYVLIGFHAGTDKGVASALFYLLTYTFLVLGSFAVVTIVGRKGDRHHSMDDYRGLGSSDPILAGVLTLFLLAQAGVPLTSGFMGKFTVFSAAVEAHQYSIVIIGLLATVVATFFYLRLIVVMYMTPAPAATTTGEDVAHAPTGNGSAAGGAYAAGAASSPPMVATAPRARLAIDPAIAVAIGLAVAATVAMGVAPQPVIKFARDASLLF